MNSMVPSEGGAEEELGSGFGAGVHAIDAGLLRRLHGTSEVGGEGDALVGVLDTAGDAVSVEGDFRDVESQAGPAAFPAP